MAIDFDPINVGTVPNNGQGDNDRTAWTKQNKMTMDLISGVNQAIAAGAGKLDPDGDGSQLLGVVNSIGGVRKKDVAVSDIAASTSDAQAGTATNKVMTPALTKAQLTALAPGIADQRIGASVGALPTAAGTIAAAVSTSATPGITGGSVAFPSAAGGGNPGPYKIGQALRAILWGSASAPASAPYYPTAPFYIEAHYTGDTGYVSDWGNPTKISAQVVEVAADAGFSGELNAISARVQRSSARRGTHGYDAILNALSLNATVAAPNGSDNDDAWAANFTLTHKSGNLPANLVGVETDLVHVLSCEIDKPPGTLLADGVTPARNVTAYWAQADGLSGAISNVAWFASHTPQSGGWNFLNYFKGNCASWMVSYTTLTNNATARGALFSTQYVGTDGVTLQCEIGSPGGKVKTFRVTNDLQNPIIMQLIGNNYRIIAKQQSALTSSDMVLVGVLA